jgi:hypothetical protein
MTGGRCGDRGERAGDTPRDSGPGAFVARTRPGSPAHDEAMSWFTLAKSTT